MSVPLIAERMARDGIRVNLVVHQRSSAKVLDHTASAIFL